MGDEKPNPSGDRLSDGLDVSETTSTSSADDDIGIKNDFFDDITAFFLVVIDEGANPIAKGAVAASVAVDIILFMVS